MSSDTRVDMEMRRVRERLELIVKELRSLNPPYDTAFRIPVDVPTVEAILELIDAAVEDSEEWWSDGNESRRPRPRMSYRTLVAVEPFREVSDYSGRPEASSPVPVEEES